MDASLVNAIIAFVSAVVGVVLAWLKQQGKIDVLQEKGENLENMLLSVTGFLNEIKDSFDKVSKISTELAGLVEAANKYIEDGNLDDKEFADLVERINQLVNEAAKLSEEKKDLIVAAEKVRNAALALIGVGGGEGEESSV